MNKIEYFQKDGSLNSALIFNGEPRYTLLEISKLDYIPISTAQIMEQRIIFAQKEKETSLWNGNSVWDNSSIDTRDVILYSHDGKIKIDTSRNMLKSIVPRGIHWDNIEKGALILPYPGFNSSNGFIFERDEIEQYVNRPLTLEEAIKNPLWFIFAGEDKALLKEYVQYIYSKKANPNNLMKISITKEIPNNDLLRILNLSSTTGGSSISGDGSNGRINSKFGHIIAISARKELEVKKIINESLEERFELAIKEARNSGLISPALDKIFEKYKI